MSIKYVSPLIALILPFLFMSYAEANTNSRTDEKLNTLNSQDQKPSIAQSNPTTITTTISDTPSGPSTTTTATTPTNNPAVPNVTSTTTIHSDGTVTPTVVVPTTAQPPAPPNMPQSNLPGTDDRTVRETIEKQIGLQPLLATTDITVISSGGNVVLSGTAQNQGQVDAAMSLAASVPGVKNVRSDIVLQNR